MPHTLINVLFGTNIVYLFHTLDTNYNFYLCFSSKLADSPIFVKI